MLHNSDSGFVLKHYFILEATRVNKQVGNEITVQLVIKLYVGDEDIINNWQRPSHPDCMDINLCDRKKTNIHSVLRKTEVKNGYKRV